MKKLLMFLICFVLSYQVFGGIKNVSLDFELSETAINRALVSQFNDPNFVFQHFTGTFELNGVTNVPYSVELTRPSVVIGTNFIGIHLSFSFEASIGSIQYNSDFEVTPTITVNDISISGSNVVAFWEDLYDVINSHTEIEWEIRALLIGLYSEYEPQIYAAKLFNEILEELNSDEFIQQRAFSITDFGISPAFNSGKLVVKVIIEITYSSTSFHSYLRITSGSDYIRFGSNIKCKVTRLVIWNQQNQEVYRNENLNIELSPDEEVDFNFYADIDIGNHINNVSGNCKWYILYENDVTFYFNKYINPGGNWTLPTVNLNH